MKGHVRIPVRGVPQVAAALLVALLSVVCHAAPATAPPNILLILADDVGAEASSLYALAGNSGPAPMPNIEKLAGKGLVFDNAWVNPMCSPTRATILSGLYGHHTGVLVAGDVLPSETVTIWDYISRHGAATYDMATFGKWHLGGNGGDIKQLQSLRVPNFRGFLGAQVTDYFDWKAWDGNTGESTQVATYSTTALTDWAIEFLAKHEATRPADPWFIYMPYNAAHAPFQVPPDGMYREDLGGEKAGTRKASVPVYKAMIEALDVEIGRLLQHVDLRNTVVIYLGDNGTQANVKDQGAKVRGSKTSAWEGGARVPLTIAGAGVTRKGRDASLVNGTDLYATVAALAGAKVRQVNDGFNLMPLFTSKSADTGREFAFTEFCTGQTARFALRDARHKLVYDDKEGWGLYDLKDDIGEQHNLYGTVALAATQAKLKAGIDRLKANATKGCFRD
jgi:arylsulfatase A-like enzyme